MQSLTCHQLRILRVPYAAFIYLTIERKMSLITKKKLVRKIVINGLFNHPIRIPFELCMLLKLKFLSELYFIRIEMQYSAQSAVWQALMQARRPILVFPHTLTNDSDIFNRTNVALYVSKSYPVSSNFSTVFAIVSCVGWLCRP